MVFQKSGPSGVQKSRRWSGAGVGVGMLRGASDFMFLLDLKYISNTFELLWDGSSYFVGGQLFEKCQNAGFLKC